MKKLVEYELENGGTVLVEVEVPDEPGMKAAGVSAGKMVEKAKQTFDAALDQVGAVSEVVLGKLRQISSPDEIQVEFGLKMNLEGSAFIATAGAEANFKVALKWMANGGS